jgi:hypothetical protein
LAINVACSNANILFAERSTGTKIFEILNAFIGDLSFGIAKVGIKSQKSKFISCLHVYY